MKISRVERKKAEKKARIKGWFKKGLAILKSTYLLKKIFTFFRNLLAKFFSEL